jgi:uncharacterized protein YqeY
MPLISQIEADLAKAIKDRDELKKTVLRSLKSALQNASIEKNQKALTEAEELEVVSREIKRRKEAIAAYQGTNKPELVANEQAELAVLTAYLPAQLTEEEIRKEVKLIISNETLAPVKLGQVMSLVSQKLKGRADMSVVAQIVKDELAKLS